MAARTPSRTRCSEKCSGSGQRRKAPPCNRCFGRCATYAAAEALSSAAGRYRGTTCIHERCARAKRDDPTPFPSLQGGVRVGVRKERARCPVFPSSTKQLDGLASLASTPAPPLQGGELEGQGHCGDQPGIIITQLERSPGSRATHSTKASPGSMRSATTISKMPSDARNNPSRPSPQTSTANPASCSPWPNSRPRRRRLRR